MYALGLFFLRQTFINSIIILIDNVWIKFKLEVKSIIINKYFLPLLEKYYYYYKSEGLFITLSLVVLDFRCLLAPKSLAGYIFNWFSVYYFFPTGSFSSLYLVLLGSGSNISLLDLLYFIWAMLNIILFCMDIIYLLTNDVKSFQNHPHICLIIYMFSMLLLVISSVVLILLINILMSKVVNILYSFFEEYIVKTTGGDPAANPGGDPAANPGRGPGPAPNPGGGPDPNSEGTAPTGVESNKKGKRRSKEQREKDLQKFKSSHPFPLYAGQTQEEYDKAILKKEEKYNYSCNVRERKTGIREPQKKTGIREPRKWIRGPQKVRSQSVIESDIEKLMRDNPRGENEDIEEYATKIYNKDQRENTIGVKELKSFKEAFGQNKHRPRTKEEVKESKDDLRRKHPKPTWQSVEKYERIIQSKDENALKKKRLDETKKAYKDYLSSGSFSQPQNVSESSTQAQNAPESSIQEDIYGVSSDEERRKKRKKK